MINREITYERSVSRSYMKIPACVEATFDEEIMLKKEISGLLQVEKCYLNGSGQYWYNITGKQALDSFIKMKTIGITFVEKLLLNICSQIEKLEWNLLGTNCLVLEPELIFISNGSEEIYFTLYPDNKGEVYTEITKLVEYLLTKLDHKDAEAVKTAYGIYELTLTEGYSIADIRTAIEKRKTESVVEEKREDIKGGAAQITERVIVKPQSRLEKPVTKKPIKFEECSAVLQELWKKALEILRKEVGIEKKDKLPLMVEPEPSEEYMQNLHVNLRVSETNPTVCLMSKEGKAKGILLHEGLGKYPDFELEKKNYKIGNHPTAELYIKKDTISTFHAEIAYNEDAYYIEDLNSTNGTYLNDIPVNYKEKEKLSPGDVIRFADVRYRFM